MGVFRNKCWHESRAWVEEDSGPKQSENEVKQNAYFFQMWDFFLICSNFFN